MNRVALITGASRGIGRGIALELARLGHDLVINYAGNTNAAQQTAKDCVALAQDSQKTIRAEMCQAGIRVVNAFPGPIDDEWNQLVPPPKLGAPALANAIVRALRDGVEDIYPGDVAQDIVARFRENQKALERELWDR